MTVGDAFRKVPVGGIGPEGRTVVAWTLVSVEDYEWVSAMSWSLAGLKGYPQTAIPRGDGTYRMAKLHRLILGEPEGLQVDHINGDRLDNRRENLREATNSQNRAGFSSGKPGATGVRGVYLTKHGTYTARVTHMYKVHQKSGFKTLEEAVAWRNDKGEELHGEHYFANEMEREKRA